MTEKLEIERGSLISTMFLVAGTCVGGGMLALPVVTGVMGFIPSLSVMILSWLAMTCTGLLLLEVSLWMPEGAHIISMSSRFLGEIGRIVSWLLYLFICYASLVAYTAAGGLQLTSVFAEFGGSYVPDSVGCIVFMILFGSIISFGGQVVGRVNAFLFVAVILSYVGLVVFGLPEIKTHFLSRRAWEGSALAIPLLLTSFSYQTIVPSLTPLLKRNPKELRWAIVGGTFIALIVYLVWQGLILGVVPLEGPYGLLTALENGEPINRFFHIATNNSWVSYIAEYFAFFAVVTSFLGMALGLFDFLADGLAIKKTGWGKLLLNFLIVIPTVYFAIMWERAFLLALDASGGFGDSILNGLIPILMVWVGRYQFGLTAPSRLPGGKLSLIILFLFFLAALGIEIGIHLWGLTPGHRTLDV